MTRLQVSFICLVGAVFASPCSAAPILWYNGDPVYPNGFVGWPSFYHSPTLPFYSEAYDNFIVPAGQIWTVQEIFAHKAYLNDQSIMYITQANWQIRSGMSDGNPGVLVASGMGSITKTPTGNPNAPLNYLEYRIELSGLNVVLNPGTYWLDLQPITTNAIPVMSQAITYGANAIGVPPGNDGQSFLTFNFSNTFVNYYQSQTFDFSLGVRGLQTVIPEPATLMVVAVMAVGAIGWRRRSV